MNILKLVRYTVLTACFMLAMNSCDDFLTLDNENKTVSEGYYDSPQKIEQAVTGAYVNLRRALLGNYAWLMYGEVRAGDLTVSASYSSYVADQNLTADNDNMEQLRDWGYFYDAIKSCNDILEIIDEVDDGVLSDYQHDLYKGEALAMKSMSYFYLARIWGDVPSAEEADFGTLVAESSVVDRSISYAKQAKDLLPWMLVNDDGIESSALTEIHFNKTAATMLLAQENLWAGNDQESYDLLESTFTAEVLKDSLSDFALSVGEDERTDIPDDPLDGSVVSISIGRLDSIYPSGDSRRSSMFTISSAKATLIVDDEDVLPLLTTNELYLLLAESAWKTNRLGVAISYISSAASGATEDYSTLTDDTFEDALVLERQRLLMGTGQRFFDLIRFGKVSSMLPFYSESDVSDGAAYWPLSTSSMSDNSLSQNSYWSE
jgi:hypothetical protein